MELSGGESMSDMISRQAAIELANSLKDNLPDDERIADIVMAHNEGILEYQTKLSLLPSTQPKQSNASEFWRKRADYYRDMCMNLIGEMGKGVKVESVKISENGIEFIKGQPSVQPEIIHCKDCIRYGRDDCFMKIQMLWELKPDDYCSYAERRSDG